MEIDQLVLVSIFLLTKKSKKKKPQKTYQPTNTAINCYQKNSYHVNKEKCAFIMKMCV